MAYREIRRVAPLSAANICAVLLGGMGAIFVLVFFVASVIEGLVGSSPQTFSSMFEEEGVVIFFFPFLYLVLGWIQGGIAAILYNFTAGFTGGIRVEVVEDEGDGISDIISDT
jgi:hypothetical protein